MRNRLVLLDEKREAINTPVTLNGKPAQVVGGLQPFATVRTLDPYGQSLVYAWETVLYVIAHCGGRFKYGTK